jgi:hypothetical protein
MPFTVSWVDIPNSDIDPDSPVTTTLMTELRDNPDFVSQWVGVRATAAVNHAHKGAATDGTAKIAYSDISGVPTGFVKSVSLHIDQHGNSGDFTYSTGALGFTPVQFAGWGFMSKSSSASSLPPDGNPTGAGVGIAGFVSCDGTNQFGLKDDSSIVSSHLFEISGPKYVTITGFDVTNGITFSIGNAANYTNFVGIFFVAGY